MIAELVLALVKDEANSNQTGNYSFIISLKIIVLRELYSRNGETSLEALVWIMPCKEIGIASDSEGTSARDNS